MRPFRVHGFRDNQGRRYKVPQFGEGGTSFVVVHGFGASTDDYARFAAAVASTNRGTTYLFPIPGLGNAPSLGSSVTLDDLIEFNHGISTGLHLPPDTVRIGESFGGGLEIEYAARHPEHVGGLVAIAPNNTPDPDAQAAALGNWAMNRLWTQVFTSPLEAWVRSIEIGVAAIHTPPERKALIKVASEMDTLGASAKIAKLKIPAILVRGMSDRVVPHDKAVAHSRIMGAKYETVRGDHGIALDASRDLVTTIQDFAASVPVRERGASNRKRVRLTMQRPAAKLAPTPAIPPAAATTQAGAATRAGIVGRRQRALPMGSTRPNNANDDAGHNGAGVSDDVIRRAPGLSMPGRRDRDADSRGVVPPDSEGVIAAPQPSGRVVRPVVAEVEVSPPGPGSGR